MSVTRKSCTFGGFLGRNKVFANILSVGFEFETHDLAKLSEVDGTLVNSDMTAVSLRNKVNAYEAIRADKHSYDVFDDQLFYTEYMEEPDDASTPAGEKAVMLQVTNDIARTKFTQKLFRECSKDVEEEDIEKNDLYSFRVTPRTRGRKGRRGRGKKGGEKEEGEKGEGEGPTYPVAFTDALQSTTCSLWTGLELIVTFYTPRTSENIILETFLDACRRIFVHLGDLRPMPGALFLRDRKVGSAKRILYHKPNTNLYYMQTPDADKQMGLGEVQFTPQMTFRAHAYNLVPIMLEILRAPTFGPTEKESRVRVKAQIQMEYDTLSTVDNCVARLIAEYNRRTPVAQQRINLSTRYGKSVACYLVLIMYKIHVYDSEYRRDVAKENRDREDRIENGEDEDDGSSANYLKNYLSFASRHRNYDLYVRLVDLIQSGSGDISKDRAAAIVADIIDQPAVTHMFLFKRNKRALVTRLNASHPEFGNPSASLLSYFDFMERARSPSTFAALPARLRRRKGGAGTLVDYEEGGEGEEEGEEDEEEEEDWFFSIDQYTNTFPIGDNDELMVENRMFAFEMSYFAKTVTDIPTLVSEMSVRQLRRMYDRLVVDRNPAKYSTDNIGKKEYNPKTHRYINKKGAATLRATVATKTRRV